METQNTGVRIDPFETTPEKALRLGSAAAAIEAALNSDIDHEPPARMRDLTHQRTMIRLLGTADEEMRDYPALREKVGNLAPRVSARRGTFGSPSRTSVAWVLATLAILGFLTALLIVGIAISV